MSRPEGKTVWRCARAPWREHQGLMHNADGHERHCDASLKGARGAVFFGPQDESEAAMMRKLLTGEGYAGRSPHVVPVNLSFDRETALLIDRFAPSKKERSEYLSRLVHEDRARREERQKIARALIAPE